MTPHVIYIIGSSNGLVPAQYQAINRTSDDIVSTGPFGMSFSEILIKTQNFS